MSRRKQFPEGRAGRKPSIDRPSFSVAKMAGFWLLVLVVFGASLRTSSLSAHKQSEQIKNVTNIQPCILNEKGWSINRGHIL